MKNLKITHILAMCLSFVPIALECSGASSSAAPVVAAAAQVTKKGFYHIRPGSAGHLYLMEGGTFYKYYLPSTTVGRWRRWSRRNLALAEDVRVEADQRFEFYILTGSYERFGLGHGSYDTSPLVTAPYLQLKVNVNGYAVEDVEILAVEGINITSEDLKDPYKLTNLQANILELCAQYSSFADQLQYNGTILGRGVNPNKVKQTVYDGALSPIIRAVENSNFSSEVKEVIRGIVLAYMNAYADEYSTRNLANRLYNYLKGAVSQDGPRNNISKALSEFVYFSELIQYLGYGGAIVLPPAVFLVGSVYISNISTLFTASAIAGAASAGVALATPILAGLLASGYHISQAAPSLGQNVAAATAQSINLNRYTSYPFQVQIGDDILKLNIESGLRNNTGSHVSGLYAALVAGEYYIEDYKLAGLPGSYIIWPTQDNDSLCFRSNGNGVLSLVIPRDEVLIPVRMLSGKLAGYVGTNQRLIEPGNGPVTVREALDRVLQEPIRYRLDSQVYYKQRYYLIPNRANGAPGNSFSLLINA